MHARKNKIANDDLHYITTISVDLSFEVIEKKTAAITLDAVSK
jgi:hypothetical protein